ncbi:hypothetical protein [Halorubellus sp. PRR65]|uniref:hypothetical protein n=1 Tax=Halorubellus sp. PRR65 TaxID=3098148 RepID=UPI002B25758D|nr:hypothetical protein [Halorubellus sp. PRR65]
MTDRDTGGTADDEDVATDVDEDAATDVDGNPLEPGDHALPPDDLVYPTFAFDDGSVDADGAFDLSRDVDRETLSSWLSDLAGAMASHDVAVESPDGHVRFGVGAKDVAMSFDPDDDHSGDLEVTVTLNAKAMFVADDPEKPAVGARGGRGFVPIEALTTDREEFRCYNWIDDPEDPGRDQPE